MTGKRASEFQRIANSKGWKFNLIGERWGVSERQMSRIANSGYQRDLDAVNGLPTLLFDDMRYEQIIHDQVLYCATEIIDAFKGLRKLTRDSDSKQRRMSAKQIEGRLKAVSIKCSMLEYMFDSAGRKDLKELVFQLFILSHTEATTAMSDPDGWREACDIAGQNSEPNVDNPEDAIRDWRIKFLSAISNK